MTTFNVIPFDGSAKLPAYLSARAKGVASLINQDVVGSGPAFPVLSIKGKVFTLVKGSEKKLLVREDDPDEALQSLSLTVVRANTKSRVFYAKAYTEGDSDGAKPTCFSGDGVAPDAGASEAQAKKCMGCPQNVWGVRDGKGYACSQNTRLAVIDPIAKSEPYLLRVPPASRAGFAEAVKLASSRNLDYNMLVLKVSFDKEAATPKLVFRPTGLLDDAAYAAVSEQYDSELIREIVGLHTASAEPAAETPSVDMDELDAAIAAKAATSKAAAPKPTPAPKPAPIVEEDEEDAPAPAPAPAPKAKAKPAPKPAAADSDDAGSLMADLTALLGSTDD